MAAGKSSEKTKKVTKTAKTLRAVANNLKSRLRATDTAMIEARKISQKLDELENRPQVLSANLKT